MTSTWKHQTEGGLGEQIAILSRDLIVRADVDAVLLCPAALTGQPSQALADASGVLGGVLIAEVTTEEHQHAALLGGASHQRGLPQLWWPQGRDDQILQWMDTRQM